MKTADTPAANQTAQFKRLSAEVAKAEVAIEALRHRDENPASGAAPKRAPKSPRAAKKTSKQTPRNAQKSSASQRSKTKVASRRSTVKGKQTRARKATKTTKTAKRPAKASGRRKK